MAQADIQADRGSDPDYWPDCCARCAASGCKLRDVPPRYAKQLPGLVVPLCRDHFDDWSDVARRTKIGAALIVVGIAVVAATVWEVQPQFAPNNNLNDLSRITATIVLSFLSAIPLGLLIALWTKTPIRITETQGRLATLAGVSSVFAFLFKQRPQPALPEISESLRFDVSVYHPRPIGDPIVVQRFLLACLFVAGLLGVAVGFGATEIGAATQGWDKDDWRYPFLGGLVALAYVLPFVGIQKLFTKFGLFVIVIVVGVSVLGVLAFRLFGTPQRVAFGILFSVCPFLLFEFAVVLRVIQRWRVRSIPVVVIGGSGGALVITGLIYLIARMEDGPHQAAYIIGPGLAIIFGSVNRYIAGAPFCTVCEGWLIHRRIGGLPRSVEEIRPILDSGEIVALTGIEPYKTTTTIGDVDLTVYWCEECREKGTVVVELSDCQKGGKNGKTPTLVRAGRWQYPGLALPVIDEMFPPPAAPDRNLFPEPPHP